MFSLLSWVVSHKTKFKVKVTKGQRSNKKMFIGAVSFLCFEVLCLVVRQKINCWGSTYLSLFVVSCVSVSPCVCLYLSGLYRTHSLKDYKIVWYKYLPWWNGLPGLPLKGKGHAWLVGAKPVSARRYFNLGHMLSIVRLSVERNIQVSVAKVNSLLLAQRSNYKL
jgi:hypothetical protein